MNRNICFSGTGIRLFYSLMGKNIYSSSLKLYNFCCALPFWISGAKETIVNEISISNKVTVSFLFCYLYFFYYFCSMKCCDDGTVLHSAKYAAIPHRMSLFCVFGTSQGQQQGMLG